MANSPHDVLAWIGKTVVGGDGDKLGTVEDVYLDNMSGQPAWLAVKTGLFGSRRTFVPLREARTAGDDLQVPYDTELVKGAPNVDVDGELSPDEEDRLYRHYEDRFAGTDAPDAGAMDERPLPEPETTTPATVPASPVGGTDGPDAGATAAEVAVVPLPTGREEGGSTGREEGGSTFAEDGGPTGGDAAGRRPRVRRYVIERVIVEDDGY